MEQVLRRIIVQPLDHAESAPERRPEEPLARGRAGQREPRQRDAHGPRRRPLIEHDINVEVLHRGVEYSSTVALMRWISSMKSRSPSWSFVRIRRGRPLSPSPGRKCSEFHAHLVRDDRGERGLAQAGRAAEQDVVERLLPPARRLDVDAQVLLDALLPDEVLNRMGRSVWSRKGPQPGLRP